MGLSKADNNDVKALTKASRNVERVKETQKLVQFHIIADDRLIAEHE